MTERRIVDMADLPLKQKVDGGKFEALNGRARPLTGLTAARRRFEAGDPRAAAAMARRVASSPGSPIEAVVLWGVAAAEAGDFIEAILPLETAAAHPWDQPDKRVMLDIQLGRSLIALGRWREGLETLARAETQPPSDTHLRHRLGLALTAAGRLDRAIPHLSFAAYQRPADGGMRADLAWVSAGVGRVDAAERLYEEAITIAPLLTQAHAGLAALRRWSAERNHVARLNSRLDATHDPEARVELAYALFKELDDLGRHADAWRALDVASRTAASLAPWSATEDAALIDALIRTFPAERFGPRPRRAASPASPQPIFIVGLPRTGTTLVERILSAHSRVTDLGEAPFFPLALRKAAGVPVTSPITAPTIEAAVNADWAKAGDAYLSEISGLSGGAARVVDKLPFNSLLAGAIRLALPGAHIVLVNREPMASLWSAHRNPFALGGWYGWTRTQSDLAAHWFNHRRLMDHWRAAFGPDLIEVRYEDLVTNPEPNIRALLGRCGLEPEAGCFRPHDQAGAVTTLSQSAVREPINRRAIDAWKVYAEQLHGLRDALGAMAGG